MMRKFTETIDLNTETGGPSILGLHTPISGDAYRFLYPYFMAYKKYKYVGMDVTIVNSARLPYDPEQIGKVEGTNYVDPRDSLNPVLFKGCHGESLGAILNSMYGGLTTDIFKHNSLDKQQMLQTLENFYYTALGDDAWRKSPIQKTLRLNGLHPLVYNLGTNGQIMPTNDMHASDYFENSASGDSAGPNASNAQPGTLASSVGGTARPFVITPTKQYDVSTGLPQYRFQNSMFTTSCRRLGWIDTLQMIGQKDSQSIFDSDQIALLPKLFMGLLILPPAYLTRNYLRIIITHKFKFAGYRTITTGGAFPEFDPNSTHFGYINAMTGNTTGTESSKTLSRVENLDPEIVEEEDEEIE